jgi:E3 ubiquitin-protein ligase CBL
LGQWAIGYVAPDGKIYQTIPQNKSLIQSLVDGSREGFYLYPNGRIKNVDLSFALQINNTEGRVQVSPEQYQIYCEMGTTFEMCKICDERNKNVKLEPCGHLLCRPCLNKWQEKSDGEKNCPFCRCEIKGNENVLIESFDPSSADERPKQTAEKLASSSSNNNGNSPPSSPPFSSSAASAIPTIPPRPERTVQQILSNPLNAMSSSSTTPAPPIPPKRTTQPNGIDKEEQQRRRGSATNIESVGIG